VQRTVSSPRLVSRGEVDRSGCPNLPCYFGFLLPVKEVTETCQWANRKARKELTRRADVSTEFVGHSQGRPQNKTRQVKGQEEEGTDAHYVACLRPVGCDSVVPLPVSGPKPIFVQQHTNFSRNINQYLIPTQQSLTYLNYLGCCHPSIQ